VDFIVYTIHLTLQTKKYAVKKMDDVSCGTRIYKRFQFTFKNLKKKNLLPITITGVFNTVT